MNQQVQTFDWDDMNCFRLDVSMWSGRSKLTRDDLKDPDAVPPDALASLGSLKLIDPDQLKIFNALKRRAIRACEAHGVTFLGGYVIAENRVADLDKKLVGIKQEYEQSVTNLVTKFNEQCEDWLNQNSQWAHIIRPRLPSPSDIAVKFNFDWTVFKVKPLATPSGHGSSSLDSAKNNLVDSSVDEVCRMLGESARNLLKTDRTEYTSQAFNSVDKAIGKCDELSFINPNLGVLSSFLKDIKLSVMSKAISPDVFRTIFAAVASPDSIRKVIELHKAQVPMDNMTWALSPMQPPLTITPNKTDDEPTIASVLDTVEPEPEPEPEPEYAVPTLDELGYVTAGNPIKIECEPVSCDVVKTLGFIKDTSSEPDIKDVSEILKDTVLAAHEKVIKNAFNQALDSLKDEGKDEPVQSDEGAGLMNLEGII